MKRTTILLLAVLVSACAAPVEYRYTGERQTLKNAEGHVIGQKEMLLDPTTGDKFEQITYYTPRRDEKGTIIGYEEPLPPGYVVRDLKGRRVGVRYSDLRSRGSNPGGGVTVIVKPPAERSN